MQKIVYFFVLLLVFPDFSSAYSQAVADHYSQYPILMQKDIALQEPDKFYSYDDIISQIDLSTQSMSLTDQAIKFGTALATIAVYLKGKPMADKFLEKYGLAKKTKKAKEALKAAEDKTKDSNLVKALRRAKELYDRRKEIGKIGEIGKVAGEYIVNEFIDSGITAGGVNEAVNRQIRLTTQDVLFLESVGVDNSFFKEAKKEYKKLMGMYEEFRFEAPDQLKNAAFKIIDKVNPAKDLLEFFDIDISLSNLDASLKAFIDINEQVVKVVLLLEQAYLSRKARTDFVIPEGASYITSLAEIIGSEKRTVTISDERCSSLPLKGLKEAVKFATDYIPRKASLIPLNDFITDCEAYESGSLAKTKELYEALIEEMRNEIIENFIDFPPLLISDLEDMVSDAEEILGQEDFAGFRSEVIGFYRIIEKGRKVRKESLEDKTDSLLEKINGVGAIITYAGSLGPDITHEQYAYDILLQSFYQAREAGSGSGTFLELFSLADSIERNVTLKAEPIVRERIEFEKMITPSYLSVRNGTLYRFSSATVKLRNPEPLSAHTLEFEVSTGGALNYTAPAGVSVENRQDRSYITVGTIEAGERLTVSMVLKEKLGPVALSIDGTSTSIVVNCSFDSEGLQVIFSDFGTAEKAECICDKVKFTDGVPSLSFSGTLSMNLTTSSPAVTSSLIHKTSNTREYTLTNTLPYPARFALSLEKPESSRNISILSNNTSIAYSLGTDVSFSLSFSPSETRKLTLIYVSQSPVSLLSQQAARLSEFVSDLRSTLSEVTGLASPSQIDQVHALETLTYQNLTLSELNEKVSEAEQLLKELRGLKEQEYLIPERNSRLESLGRLGELVEEAFNESVITQYVYTSLTGKINQAETSIASAPNLSALYLVELPDEKAYEKIDSGLLKLSEGAFSKFSEADAALTALSALGIELTEDIHLLSSNVSERIDVLSGKAESRNMSGISSLASETESDADFLKYLTNQYLSSVSSSLRDSLGDSMETLSRELSELSELEPDIPGLNQSYLAFADAHTAFQKARYFSGKRDYFSAIPLYLDVNQSLENLNVSETLVELNRHRAERIAEVYAELGNVTQKLNQLGYMSQSEDYQYASSLLGRARKLIEEEKAEEAHELVLEAGEIITQALNDLYTKEDNSKLGMNAALMLISSVSLVFVSQKKRLFGI